MKCVLCLSSRRCVIIFCALRSVLRFCVCYAYDDKQAEQYFIHNIFSGILNIAKAEPQ